MTKAMRITFDLRLMAWTALVAVLLCWPLYVLGRPAYIPDSLSYYRGGEVVFDFIGGKLEGLVNGGAEPAVQAASAAPGAGSDAGQVIQSKGARSVTYSALAKAFSFPNATMVLLCVVQALLTGLLVAIMARLAGVAANWRFGVLAVALAVATPLAPTVSFACPDIFAGLTIASWVILVTGWGRLSWTLRLLVMAIGSFAVTAHPSHPPLAFGMVLIAIPALWLMGLRGWAFVGRVGIVALPFALGILVTIASGIIAFGEASIAPKRFPLALARSIEDGPARWYLENHCAERNYTVCQIFGDEIPKTVTEVMWGKRGLYTLATPEQMDKIRDEEDEIVFAASREYPGRQITHTVRNIASQLGSFGLVTTETKDRVLLASDGSVEFAKAEPLDPAIVHLVEWLSILAAIGAVFSLALTWRDMPRDQKIAVSLVLLGICGNAVICAVFSGVADRYQARVIWLLPLMAIALRLARWPRRGQQVEAETISFPASAPV